MNPYTLCRLHVVKQQMRTFRYYLSSDLCGISPPTSELRTIEAESPQQAVIKVVQEERLPPNYEGLWAHFLTWTSEDGEQRGFSSIRLAVATKEPEVPRREQSSASPFAAGGTEPFCDSEKSAAA